MWNRDGTEPEKSRRILVAQGRESVDQGRTRISTVEGSGVYGAWRAGGRAAAALGDRRGCVGGEAGRGRTQTDLFCLAGVGV
jgi:hypothetical protein